MPDTLSIEIDRAEENIWTPCQDPPCYRSAAMDANQLMKANVLRLLALREKEPEDLARHMRKSASWIDKIYRYDHRTFPIRYYETIAQFLGVHVYQLLQPGIADHSERRSGSDRRKNFDRRVSQAVLSEKALDVDVVHLVRALSTSGRQQAMKVLMDILNDEIDGRRPKRTTVADADVQDRTAEKPKPKPVRRRS